MKKQILSVLCVCALLCSAGCSQTADSSSSKKSDTSESNTESTESTSESSDDLEAKLENLADALAEITGEDAETILNGEADFNFDEEVHDVYDDTAVVEAYKSGDDSALTDEKDKYILEQATAAVEDLITDDMSDYDKELAIYNYMFETTRFDDSSLAAITDDSDEDYSHTPYGFFHDHSTICVGNATTFKLFMDMLDIECEIIHSTEEGEHAWNLVKIDGDWYHVDVTFDSGTDSPAYSRFNVTDEIKEQDGYPWSIEDFHECTSTKDNYWVKNATEIADVYALPEQIKAALDENRTGVSLKLAVPDGIEADVYASQIMNIADQLISDTYYYVYFDGYVVLDDKQNVVVSLTVENYNTDTPTVTDSDVTLADIDYDKLRSLFSDTFGTDLYLSDDAEDYELNSYSNIISSYTTDDYENDDD